MKRLLAYFAAVFLCTAALGQSWDAALDQYEQISEACIRLRQKAQGGEKVSGNALVPLLNQLSNLRKSLQTASGNMTGEQRERFKAIRSRYDAAFGSRKAVAAVPCRKPDPLLSRATLPPVPETGRPSPEPRHRPLTVPATPFHVSALLYVGIPDFCPGLLLSFSKGKWGGFVKGSVSLASMRASYACYADGATDSGYIWTTGKEAAKRFSIAAGGIFSPLDFLSVYAGAGYGKRQLLWEDTAGKWAFVRDRSVSGVALDAGALFSWRHLSLLAGVSLVGFKSVCAEVGIGYRF